MRSTRLRLEPKDLRGAAARVRAEFGPHARIVAADEVRVGGIAGFFARRLYELTIEHPDDPVETAAAHGVSVRGGGLEALLEEAERLESVLPGAAGAAAQPVSTQSDAFSTILGSLTASVGVSLVEDRPPAVFAPIAGALLVITGLRDDPLRVARSVVAGLPGARLSISGELTAPEIPRIEDRRGATAVRAAGVERSGVAVVAVGLGPGGALAEANASRLAVLAPDAVWVAVDATRKPEDTARWVAAVRAAIPVLEMAVLDAEQTESPESVHDLGLRTAWPDGPSRSVDEALQ